MNVCRICLSKNPIKDLSEIKCQVNINQSGEFIVLVCLGIQIIQESEESTKFCKKCFNKIVEFHHFKSLAIRNEAVLRSIGIKEFLKDSIKTEVLSQASDNDCNDEPLIDISEVQHFEEELSQESSLECIVTEEDEGKDLNLITECKVEDTVINKCDADIQFDDKFISIKKEHETIPLKAPPYKRTNKQGRVICGHCDKDFVSKDVLKNHIRNIHSDFLKTSKKLEYKCELCSVIYARKKTLERHMKEKHHALNPECPVCKKCFTEGYIDYHIKTKHSPETLPVKCEVCNRGFVNKSLLRRHVSVHSDDKPHACEICGAKFRMKYSVDVHRRQVHEKQRNHVCHICSKGFVTNSRLQVHIRRHDVSSSDTTKTKAPIGKNNLLKPCKCPDCGKPLASVKTLKFHRELHTGEKKYNCRLCNAAFASKRYVEAHMRTHYQNPKYLCKYCDAKFVRSAARRRHELELHLEPGKKKTKKPKKTPRKSKKPRCQIKLEPNVTSSAPESYPVLIQCSSNATVLETDSIDIPFKEEVNNCTD